jgi:hypothetical protein
MPATSKGIFLLEMSNLWSAGSQVVAPEGFWPPRGRGGNNGRCQRAHWPTGNTTLVGIIIIHPHPRTGKL